jgi:ERCC4-type nuclease
MLIYVDTREQNCQKIVNYFNEKGIPWKSKKLEYGDYSLEIDGVSHENKIVIERKGSLDELAGNFTKGRERLKREFERAKEDGCKVVLMIENGSYELIMKHAYRSFFTPKAFYASLKSWEEKEYFQVEFVRKVKAGEFIVGKFLEYIDKRGD